MVKAKICFVVNPLAGLGGPLAYKGSDGEAGTRAYKRLGRLLAPSKAHRFLSELARLGYAGRLLVFTASGVMGESELEGYGFEYVVVYRPPRFPTTAEDTIKTVRECLRYSPQVIVFVGGDGTARDVCKALEVSRDPPPILGVPAGVKMYSGVFARTPEAAAHALVDYLEGRASACMAEVVDIDEDAFRRGRLSARLYAYAKTLCTAYTVTTTKQPTPMGEEEEENRRAIARYVIETYLSPDTPFILGPGTTTAAIAGMLGLPKTLLGVDVYHGAKPIALDVDEEKLYNIVKSYVSKGVKPLLIITPIGGQGFILGRGNQQISPRVLRLLGRDSIIIVATRSKMARLRKLYIDTGDPDLDRMLSGYVRVVVDYGEEQVVRVEALED